MKIRRAVKTNHINQGFGTENTIPSVLAIYKSLGLKGHEGIDWQVSCQNGNIKHGGHCEAIYYDLDIPGTIKSISTDDDFGWGVVAITNDGEVYEHLWWHMDSIAPNLAPGNVLKPGDLIGIAGNTGRSTGAHMHRQLSLMAKDSYGGYYRKDPLNGYGGCIDPMPFIENVFILDALGKFIFNTNLWFGTTGDDVKHLQDRLGIPATTFGYGVFGPKTFAAVKAYQVANNIPATGFVGILTRLKLNK